MKNEIVALIPVREGSTRIKDKNFRPFGDSASLLHHKLDKLKTADCFDHIYVSSDSEKARSIAEECGAEFLAREPYMCSSKPRWDEVIVSIMNTVPGDPHVAWTLATGPIFEDYKPAVDIYLQNLEKHDSLVGVKRIQEYLLDEHGRPLFFSFGQWHPYTNEIKPLFAVNDALFIAKKSDQISWRYWIGRKPYLYEMSSLESIDINFPDDFQMAEAAQIYISRLKEKVL